MQGLGLGRSQPQHGCCSELDRSGAHGRPRRAARLIIGALCLAPNGAMAQGAVAQEYMYTRDRAAACCVAVGKI